MSADIFATTATKHRMHSSHESRQNTGRRLSSQVQCSAVRCGAVRDTERTRPCCATQSQLFIGSNLVEGLAVWRCQKLYC